MEQPRSHSEKPSTPFKPALDVTELQSPEAPAHGKTWWENEAETPNRPLILTSIGTMGPSRESNPEARQELAGNMSENYSQPEDPALTPAEKIERANQNVNRFLHNYDLLPSHTALLRPQQDYSQPLSAVDVDQIFTIDESKDRATWLEQRGDLLITRDPEKVLAVRPADCPVIVGRGVDGNGQDILFLGHYAWRGEDAGYVDQTLDYLRDQGVDFATLRLYIAPGLRKDSAKYYTSNVDPSKDIKPGNFSHPKRELLFTNVEPLPTEDDEPKYKFKIDMQGFLRHTLNEAGIADWQIFEDDSDTGRPDSGHNSHSRAFNRPNEEVEGRDIVVATMNDAHLKKLHL